MADIEKIKGIKRISAKLQRARREMYKQAGKRVLVGYTASYALAVHENVEMKWKGLPRSSGFSVDKQGRVIVSRRVLEGGSVSFKKHGFYWDPQGKAQAKFLEEPARRLKPELMRIIKTIYAKTRNLEKAMIAAGLRLQRESQQLVPVDTGNLKNSAFTRVEYTFGQGSGFLSLNTNKTVSAGKTSARRKP